MTGAGYVWRRLAGRDREELLAWRKAQGRPWHSPPHSRDVGNLQFHVSAACFDHEPHIGRSWERMDSFARDLVASLGEGDDRVVAWCLLPNHYHALVETSAISAVFRRLARLHGRASHAWNGEEATRGRRVFYRAADRAMRSDAHVFATINYIHHNPVHHGYVERWTDWPWSSAEEYLEEVGDAESARRWTCYPVGGYGKGWDDPAR